MKRLLIGIIALLAIVTAIRAYTAQLAGPGVSLGAGLVELSDGRATLSLGFGLAETSGGQRGPWSVLPLRVQYRSGNSVLTLSLQGLSFLLAGGVQLGRPVLVDRPVEGDVVSAGGTVTVRSRVVGDVWAFGADVVLGPKAEVTGSVVSIGGRVTVDPKARVAGGVHRLAELKVPLLGVLGTRSAGLAIALGRELLLFLLAALLLLLAAWFFPGMLADLGRTAAERWRSSLLGLLVAVAVVPVLALLLAVSVAGVFFLPFLVLAVTVLAVMGSLALCVRLGAWMRRGSEISPLFLFTSGLLGLFVVRILALAGIALLFARSSAAGTAGGVLRAVSLVATAALLVWGFGVVLAHTRSTAAKG